MKVKTHLLCCHIIDSWGSAVQNHYYIMLLEPKQKEMFMIYDTW